MTATGAATFPHFVACRIHVGLSTTKVIQEAESTEVSQSFRFESRGLIPIKVPKQSVLLRVLRVH